MGSVRFSDITGSEIPPSPPDALGVFEPDAQLVAWAAVEVPGVNPLDPGILGKFQDHYRSKGVLPADIEAAYRNWLRKEPTFSAARQREILMPISGGGRRSPQRGRGSIIKTGLREAMKEAWEK
jgi:hypothetical protein